MISSLEHTLVEIVRKQFPAIFLVVDPKMQVLEANQHTLALLGDQVLGVDFHSLLADFHAKLQLTELLAQEGLTLPLNFWTCSGLLQTVQCRFLPHPQGFIVIGGVDQREQELLRAELLASNRELSNRRRELQKALDELAELNHLKDRFLAMAAHDLRHPIQTVCLISEMALLEGERPPAECLRDFQEISEANQLMGQVVDSFLSLAVLQSGSLRLDLQPTSLVQLTEETLRLVKRSGSRKQIRFNFEVRNDPGLVEVDPPKIKQALLNLLSNAVEHGPSGQEVTVRLDWSEGRVRLEVADQGGGISPELQSNLFEAFVRGASSKTAGERSSGLGLYIANLLVDAHGGKLDLRSQTGQGSVFTISLPWPALAVGS